MRPEKERRTQIPAEVLAAAAAYGPCPDCDSDVALPYPDDDGIWHVEISHDATCPTWQAMTR